MHPKVFTFVTAVVKSWMKNQITKSSAETEDLNNLVTGGLKIWEILKGPQKKGMEIELTTHANDVRFHFI